MESNDLRKGKRKWIGLGLLLIILVMTIYIYNNKDELFINKVEITYTDGCIEYYEAAILVSDICENGRMLERSAAIGGNKWIPTTNLSFVNLT